MKTFRNLLVFMLTYMMATTFVWILVMDTMTWHSVAHHGAMVGIGVVFSVFVTVFYSLEKED